MSSEIIEESIEEFEMPDKSEPRVKPDSSKYTQIDNLDEDEVISNQLFVCISFISPEGLMNCNIRGVKIRGAYATEQEARAAAEKIRKKDKFFDVFVGEMGKWLPWDPDPMHVKEAKYGNKKLNKIMKKVHEQNNDDLNELVGRKKETIVNSKKSHRDRVASSIKNNLDNTGDDDTVDANVDDNTNTNNRVEKSFTSKTKNNTHDANERRQHLRKLFEEREKAKQEKAHVDSLNQTSSANDGSISDQLKLRTENMTNEISRLDEKQSNIKQLGDKSKQISDNLAKMKDIYNKHVSANK